MTKIFVTGVTGYIGGDALYAIAAAHPEYEITALVRNTDKGARVAQHFAKVRLVYGNLDDVDLIEKESKEADVVCNWASADHEGAARAIVRGLAAHDASRPGFLIHTSGTAVLVYEDLHAGTFGTGFREKVFDDLDGVQELSSLPDTALHQDIDKMVLKAGKEYDGRVKTALVCPPTIYGEGRGPDNQRSIQLPGLAKVALEGGQAVKVNKGEAYWNNVHITDLSDLYLKLVEQAAAGGETTDWSGKPPLWGIEGFYFSENGEHVWGEVSQWIADEAKAQGYIKNNEVLSLTAEEIGERQPFGQVLWGTNSRGKARRARELLGWKPTGASLKDEVKAAVTAEAKKLGLKPGHAEIAAGNA